MRRNSILVTELRQPASRRVSASDFEQFTGQTRSIPMHTRSRTHPSPLSPIVQEYDVLYENQRGFYILGIPKFSPNLLNPLDPPAWCDRKNKGVSTDIQNHPLPDPTWEWVGSNWLVDMSGDVDPNGWQYAFRFGKKSWRGDSKLFHNFVRRRRWIRLRRKKFLTIQATETDLVMSRSPSIGSPPATPNSMESLASQSSDTASLEPISLVQENSDLTQQLNCSRVDREKIALIQSVVDQRNTPFTEVEIEDILNCLEFDSSRNRLHEIIDKHTVRCNSKEIKLKPDQPTTKQLNSPPEYIQNSSDLVLHPDALAPTSNPGTAPSLYLDARSFIE